MAGGGVLHAPHSACPIPRRARRGAPADAMDRRRCRAGERGHPHSRDAQSVGGVAGPDRCPRRRRHSAGGSRPTLRGQPAPCPARRPPARELALDSRLHRRGVGYLPHRGPRSRQDPDGDDRPRGARLVDRGRRHRRRWLHPRPGPVRAHGDRFRLRRTRGPRRSRAHVREPTDPGHTHGRAAVAVGRVASQDARPAVCGDLHRHR